MIDVYIFTGNQSVDEANLAQIWDCPVNGGAGVHFQGLNK